MVLRQDRSLWSLMAFYGVSIALMAFIGSTALIEADHAILSLVSEAHRLTTSLGLSFILLHYHGRLITSGEVQQILALPLSKPAYVLSSLAAFLPMVFLFLGIYTLFTGFFPYLSLGTRLQWAGAIASENICLIILALFFCLGTHSFFKSSLLTVCVYFLGRVRDFIINSSTLFAFGDDPSFASLNGGAPFKALIKVFFTFFPGFDRIPVTPLHHFDPTHLVDIALSTCLFLLLTLLVIKKIWF